MIDRQRIKCAEQRRMTEIIARRRLAA